MLTQISETMWDHQTSLSSTICCCLVSMHYLILYWYTLKWTPESTFLWHFIELKILIPQTIGFPSLTVFVTDLHDWPNSQIPRCTSCISHNAPFRTEMCTFLFWMVHCGICKRCIVGFVRLVYCQQQTDFTNPTMCLFHILQYTPFRTMCTFLFWMVHCGIWNRCIVEFVSLFCCHGFVYFCLSHEVSRSLPIRCL